jgi:hypothetical protein
MSVTFIKSKNYCLVNNKIILDIPDGLTINRLKNLNENSFTYDEINELWMYSNYKSVIPLVKLLNPDLKIKSIDFKNDDVNDYRRDNIEITLDDRFIDNFNPPSEYTVLKSGLSYKVTEGKFAGQYRNMYWKVRDSNDLTYWIMHIKDDIYTKFSKRDINKVIDFCGIRPSWYLNANGYIGSTIRVNNQVHNIYLHQLIMDVHDEDLTNLEKTVDHINQDKLDNRRQNLRLVNMSVQNSNRDKPTRRVDACELPDCIQQTDLPKYVVYRKEWLDESVGKYREYFYICNHPNMERRWETSKSMEISLKEKLKQAKLKIQEIEGQITEKQYDKQSGQDKKIDLPQFIRLTNERNKLHFVFEKRENDCRMGYQMVLKSTNIQAELDNFIDEINKKYPKLSMEKYTIAHSIKLKNNEVSENKNSSSDIKLNLPPNFSFFKETKDGYQFSYSKIIDGIRLNSKMKLYSNDIQKEFNDFVQIVNKKYPQVKLPNYQIPNIPDLSTQPIVPVKLPTNQTEKPNMPTNFSICRVNNIDHIQFCKKIDNKKYQYKTKINSLDIKSELLRFIGELNKKYDFNLDPTDYPLTNTHGWTTTNPIES